MRPARGIVFALLVVTAIGVVSLLLQREVASTIQAAVGLSVLWAVLVGGAALNYARRREGLTRPLIATLVLGGAVAAVAFYFGSVRDDVVDEDIVQPAQAAPPGRPARAANVAVARGSFAGADGHDGSGTATVVGTAGGDRVLTFSDFDVDRGVKVEVWLTTGPGETADRVELGGLKGNVGDQQYAIPPGTDLARHSTVVLYCTPFTVRIAVAPLSPA